MSPPPPPPGPDLRTDMLDLVDGLAWLSTVVMVCIAAVVVILAE